ncbi:altronate dehydratase family protein [Utexia brackfieldae]|uniref:UxaA family hydrolase n=1 Tax=Utexia brackfieldae TaxID=3074108 RepID=UPI00370CFDDB
MKNFIQINPNDNVLIALEPLMIGDKLTLNGETLIMRDEIPAGHKVAIRPIPVGQDIIKYGFPIGHTAQMIEAGAHVHTHNVKTNLNQHNDYQYQSVTYPQDCTIADRQIEVYRRQQGGVGIRNELWIIPTVGCVNGIAQQIAKQFITQLSKVGDSYDQVFVLTHPYGCSQLGKDHQDTRTILQDMVKHPNAGGVLVVGLGCENNQLAIFRQTLGEYDTARTRFMILQEEADEIATGIAHLAALYQQIKQDKRQPGWLSELKFGLECGGSDGLSGITANPLLGQFSDYVIAHGGTSVLTEVPEMFGAETILMSHCRDQVVFDKTVNMVNRFKHYFIEHGQPIDENPSPGNKAGGITTLEDKSLGCTQKAGRSQVVDVLEYGERLSKAGLNLLSAPGNDAVATSALIAAGCHMVLFSTGRGTPYGGFVPTVKLSTNTLLATKKPTWIDFDAGPLINGVSMAELLSQFIDLIVNIANGEPACNEKNSFKELAIFKNGVTE